MKFEINEKYKQIYDTALGKKAPEPDNSEDGVFCEDENGNYVPATPIGYDDEQLAWDAVHDVIHTAFTQEHDYVCWSNGGYVLKDKNNYFETLEGNTLKAYDPVLLLDNFGYPIGFMMFTGKVTEDGSYLRPEFKYIGEDDLRTYRPKLNIPSKVLKKEYKEKIMK